MTRTLMRDMSAVANLPVTCSKEAIPVFVCFSVHAITQKVVDPVPVLGFPFPGATGMATLSSGGLILSR